MAPPLALLAKRQFPLPCQAIIQKFAADKRDPHPVALLVKNIDASWVELSAHGHVVFCLVNYRAGGRQHFQYTCGGIAGARDGEFTGRNLREIENGNKRLKRGARHDADERNSWEGRPNIHSCLLGMRQEMQGCKFLPGSLSSCSEHRGTPRPYLSNTWPARGWSKRGSKRKWPRSYRNNRVDSDSDF